MKTSVGISLPVPQSAKSVDRGPKEMLNVAQVTDSLVSVIIAESSRMSCQLIAEAFRRSPGQFAVIGCAANSADLLRAVGENRPDVAIVSTNLQDGALSGLAVLPELRVAYPETHVIMLLDFPERRLVIDSFRGGARGVVCREQPFEVLCKCVQVVRRGQIWASSKELGYIMEAFAEAAPLRRINHKGSNLLTEREREVARLVAEGHTNRGIAHQLNLSEHTVRNYLFRIFDKLGVSNRVELTLCCFDHRESAQMQLVERPRQLTSVRATLSKVYGSSLEPVPGT